MRLACLSLVVAVLVSTSPSGEETRIAPWLQTAMRQARTTDRHLVWVYFRDKGVTDEARARGDRVVSARARARRAARTIPSSATALEDAPLDRRYVQQVSGLVARVRHESRWLNAVSAEATAAQVQAIAALPFVARVDLVKRYRRLREEPLEPVPSSARGRAVGPADAAGVDYGTGLDQVAQLNVPALHDRGLAGEGVLIAVFDAGFPNLGHEAFSAMTIVAERDFVNGRDSVRQTTASHGTNTLSTLGGFKNGQLVGPAYRAAFMLAVTEDVRSETPVEEDNWTAAAEWAEREGADVISSSLGYLDFDLPFTSYTDADMDGATAISTKAAAMAAARGVIVVNSAGNQGWADHNTLGAPADGKQVLAVGAVDRAGVRTSFSSVGPTTDGRIKPDVAALGLRAKVASIGGVDRYSLASGTSFSCPLTAGVVALLLQAHPDYTVDQVLTALRSTASQSASPDNLLGWGIVDAVAAVDLPLPSEPPQPTPGPVRLLALLRRPSR